MTIRFTCPSCHRALEVPQAHAGARGICPDCGHVIDVPVLLQRSEPGRIGQAPAPPDAPTSSATMSGQAPPPFVRPQPTVGPRVTAAATWSLVLGILGCIMVGLGALTAIPGMVVGVVGLKAIRNSSGRLIGRRRAVTGIVLNGVALLLFTGAVVTLVELTPVIKDSFQQEQIASDAGCWHGACSEYGANNNGQMPPDLRTALATGSYSYGYGFNGSPSDFEYLGKGRRVDEPGDRLLLYAVEADRKDRRWAVFMGGRTKQLSVEDLHKELQRLGVPEDEWP
ncbi:MAG: hypothetical protein JXL80_07940 [Planctomycetes bacterium]|nr:hypothetical protein [Planctomycetota bacterium]